MTDFADRVLAWFDDHGRKDLPWQVEDSYRVWISEIMLQQTQVRTVIPYYERFIERFPDVVSLADAPVDDVLHHWSGLGYYARARNLHRAAGIIRDEHGGALPADFEAVAALPGIGRSTAGAILALGHGQRHAILDGNVKRVLARHDAVDGWPGTTAVQKTLWSLAEARTPSARVGDYTQAIMDLGATLCTRTRPRCDECPVASDCAARIAGTIERYPGRKPKKPRPLKTTTMLIALADGAVYLERRPPAGIWGGLWSFPEIDLEKLANKIGDNKIGDSDPNSSGKPEQTAAWIELGSLSPIFQAWRTNPVPPAALEEWDTVRHGFSHYDLDIRPLVARLDTAITGVDDRDDALWYRLDDRPPGGLAAPVTKLIERLRT